METARDNAFGLDRSISPASAGLYGEKDGRYQIWLEVNCFDDPGGVIAKQTSMGLATLLGRLANTAILACTRSAMPFRFMHWLAAKHVPTG